MASIYPELSIKPSLSVLNPDQIEQIHAATLTVLEKTGIRVEHPKALEMFQGAGAKVIGNRVYIPGDMVADAIDAAPSCFPLGKPDGEFAFLLEENKSWFGAGLDCMDYIDPFTDERRPFTSEDCRITASIANALTNYTWVMTLGLAADVPAGIADRIIAKYALTNCQKPLVFCCGDVSSLRAIYQMAVLVGGGRDRFREAPSIVHVLSPVSPLSIYDDGIERIIFCAEKGIPQIIYSGLQAGSTAPATFSGTIVQGSAESLGGLVLAQLVKKGAPSVYGAFTTIMDMTTTIFSYGAPEMNLMTAAMAQMARYYHLPFFGVSGCSDAKFPDDPQAAVEATFSCLSAILSGANLIHDNGLLDHSTAISPSYLVLIDEVLGMVNQYMGGISIDSETLALDLIDHVGPGGHYLEETHTLNHFRDVWYPKLFDRSIYQEWIRKGAISFKDRLCQRTRNLVNIEASMASPDVIKEIDRMAARWLPLNQRPE